MRQNIKKLFFSIIFLISFFSLIYPLSTFAIDRCLPSQVGLSKCEKGIMYECSESSGWEELSKCPNGCKNSTECNPFCVYDKKTYLPNQYVCQGNNSAQALCSQEGKWQITICPYLCNPGEGMCNPNKGCQPGNYKCDGRNLMICKLDGSDWELKQECEIDQTCSANNKTCVSKKENYEATSQEIDLSAPTGFTSLGKLTLDNAIPSLVNLIYIISSLTFFVILLSGGLKWLTSGGDEKKVASARSQITHGLIGLAIVFSVWALTNLISQLFGFNLNQITVFKKFHQPETTVQPQ